MKLSESQIKHIEFINNFLPMSSKIKTGSGEHVIQKAIKCNQDGNTKFLFYSVKVLNGFMHGIECDKGCGYEDIINDTYNSLLENEELCRIAIRNFFGSLFSGKKSYEMMDILVTNKITILGIKKFNSTLISEYISSIIQEEISKESRISKESIKKIMGL